MTAAEILERLLDELGDLKCPRGHDDFAAHDIAGDRARLIFGEAA